MGEKMKSVLLSALVLPGLGQLHRGDRVKGGVMILLDNVFILGGLYVALKSVAKVMLAGEQGAVNPEQVLAAIRGGSPWAGWLLWGFVALWVYGVVEAALHKNK